MNAKYSIQYTSLLLYLTYKYNMSNMKNEYWSSGRPYYILYQDKTFLKDIYAQLFIEFPDVGEIAYIGASTHRLTRDYSLDRRTS